MKQSSKDKLHGTVDQVAGKVKEKIGRSVKDPAMEDEGRSQKIAGKVGKKIGQIEGRFEKVLGR